MISGFLYTDGGARGNPGPAGAGAVLFDENNKKIAEISRFIGISTNNQAEYKALIFGLKEAVNAGIDRLTCFLDSELVVRQLNGEYRVKDEKLKPLFKETKDLASNFTSVLFKHVKRADNKLADRLVNEAIDLETG